jgi:twitching motility two-component system response regulator PilG
MNQISSDTTQVATNPYPIDLIAELSSHQANGCLQVIYNSLTYQIYLQQGKLIYATNSLEPFERLERHLRRLSHQVKTLNSEVRSQVNLNFDTQGEKTSETAPDYQAIYWLVEQQYLTEEQANILVQRMVQEVLESYFLLPNDCQHNFKKNVILTPQLLGFDLSNLMEECQQNLKGWQSLASHICSTYQRPYYFSKPNATVEQQSIGKIVRGFSFRQLAAILNQDELTIAKKLYPLIANKTIILREPQPPFDLSPKISKKNITVPTKTGNSKSVSGQGSINLSDISNTEVKQKQWKIVCIDDSPTILNEIGRFLDRDDFAVFPITEPLKALMKIIRIQPDLILLDVGMPNIDGYKLCSLIRKYSAFKDTPIVMVTGNKGLIDRAKARMAGATDYMTKPFTQSDLLTMVFRYLT